MERKKWTHQATLTTTLLNSREKRKWQVALRRYVLEKNRSPAYACYFGLPIEQFRQWIEIQFTPGLNWENFGAAWQFEHILPVTYFDFSLEEDLLLCWNFINIRVEKIESSKKGGKGIDLIAAKPYFEALYNKTGYPLCLKMTDKINLIESSNMINEPVIEDFIINNKERLDIISSFSKDEFNNLNLGVSLNDILLE